MHNKSKEIFNLYANHNFKKALSLMNIELRKNSNNLFLLSLKGSLLGKTKKTKEAVLILDNILNHKKLDKKLKLITLINKAEAFIAVEKFKEATFSLNLALEIDPKNHTALEYLGRCMLHLKNYKEAVKLLYEAHKLEPNCITNLKHLFDLYYERDKLEVAEKFLDKLIELDNRNHHWFEYKGNILAKRNKLNEAVGYYNKGYKLDPKCNSLLTNRAIALTELKNFPEALKSVDEAVKATKDASLKGNSLLLKAQILYNQNKHKNSKEIINLLNKIKILDKNKEFLKEVMEIERKLK